MSTLSIVIPTYRRPAILKACLEHLEKQTIVNQLEVIVVNDGHDPETESVVNGKTWMMPVMYKEVPKSQQGVARNVGVKDATGDIVIFINDDILLDPNACAMHLSMHSKHPHAAVLGFTEWDPAVGITPVMRWLDETGWQFAYGKLGEYAGKEIPAEWQHRVTYASHVSVPREIALSTPFPENLTEYGWEDIVWGAEIQKKNVPLLYEPSAKALHHHHIELDDSLKRMHAIGKSAAAMAKINPAFDRIPKGWKLFVYRLLSLLPTIRGKHAKAFLNGMFAVRKP